MLNYFYVKLSLKLDPLFLAFPKKILKSKFSDLKHIRFKLKWNNSLICPENKIDFRGPSIIVAVNNIPVTFTIYKPTYNYYLFNKFIF
jgi:hypothetical protein